jgi:isopenicillin N synthase-like dioxygenase
VSRPQPSDSTFPIIDLTGVLAGDPDACAAAAQRVGDACASTGFFLVSGHGVEQAVIDEMYGATARFFALDPARKQPWKSPVGSLYRGYEEVVDDGIVLRENFQAGRFRSEDEWMLAGYGDHETGEWEPNRWPTEPADLQPVWERYFDEVERLGNLLLELCATALDLPADWFVPLFDRQASGWMANFYPVQDDEPPTGSLRLGGHTDSGSLTILYQDDRPGGLQVRLRSGEWVDVPATPGTFVVNIGDLMAIWSNGTWADTMHRVVHAPAGATAGPRISIPYFQGPNRDAIIAPVPTRIGADRPPRFAPQPVMAIKRERYENPVRREQVRLGLSPGIVDLAPTGAPST